MLFNAKESIYLAWFPLAGTRLEFEDARLTVDPVAGTFSADPRDLFLGHGDHEIPAFRRRRTGHDHFRVIRFSDGRYPRIGTLFPFFPIDHESASVCPDLSRQGGTWMITNGIWRRRLLTFLAAGLTVFLGSALAAAPARATLGAPQPVSLQLRGYMGSTQVLVGRAVGTIQLDDSNSAYQLSIILCRQSSYVAPTLRVSVNGVQQQVFSGDDGVRRPSACGDTFGQSIAVNGTYGYSGVVRNMTIQLDGIFFDGSTNTAYTKTKSAFYAFG